MTTTAGRALLDLVSRLDNPDITGASLMVSVEFLRHSVGAIETEAAIATLTEIEKRVMPWIGGAEQREAIRGVFFRMLDELRADRSGEAPAGTEANQQFVEALLANFREYGASEMSGDDVADEIQAFARRLLP